MTKSNFIRWSGLAAILAGLLRVAGQLVELIGNERLEWVDTPVNGLLLVALTGIYLFQRQEAGIWGTLGYIIAMAGTLVFLFDFLAEALILVGASGLSVGLILLAVGTLKAGKLPRWAPLLWILAPVVGMPGFFWEILDTPLLWTAAAVLFGFGLIGAGFRLWMPAT